MEKGMSLADAFAFVVGTYGLCSVCDAEHEWANVKCDLMYEPAPKMGE